MPTMRPGLISQALNRLAHFPQDEDPRYLSGSGRLVISS